MHRHASEDRLREEQDNELAEALKVALSTYGPQHPLVAAALTELRAKERKATPVGRNAPDEVQRLVFSESANRHRLREPILADRLLWLLNEAPMREVRLEGMGRCLVDFYFPGHRLVVEEDGHCHYGQDSADRDERLNLACECLGLKLMRVGPAESIDLKHIASKLKRLGISVDGV